MRILVLVILSKPFFTSEVDIFRDLAMLIIDIPLVVSWFIFVNRSFDSSVNVYTPFYILILYKKIHKSKTKALTDFEKIWKKIYFFMKLYSIYMKGAFTVDWTIL